MSLHDSSEPIERTGSATKRISTLNDHEQHILRRRINAYQKIHNKEIADVSSQLEEIRESMKALATDPLYGTHALKNTGDGQGGSPRSPVANYERTSKLRRTQSFPELLDGSHNGSAGANHSSFPALKCEHHPAARLSFAKSGERTVFNDVMPKPRSRSIGSHVHHVHDSAGKEASDGQEQGHKKLERSKTAPVAMLQPLLRTTPEMMRRKIQISSSSRLSTDEFSARRGLSPRFGDASSRIHPTHLQQAQADLGNLIHRPKTTPDSQPMVNLKLASHSVHESKLSKFAARDVSAKRVPARAEQNDGDLVSLQTVKGHGRKTSSNPFYKFKEDLFETNEVSDKGKGIDDLRSCRYLRFSKESHESNRI